MNVYGYTPATIASAKIGARVRSHYRAHWTGTVVEHVYIPPRASYGAHWNVIVRVTHDRNGRPLRKSLNKRIDPAWLEVLP